MTDTDIDEKFEQILCEIEEEKPSLTENEQNVLDAWLSKLKEIDEDEEKPLKYEYIKILKAQLNRNPKRLSLPFTDFPPQSNLPPLQDDLYNQPSTSASTPDRRRYFCTTTEKKIPCNTKGSTLKKREATFAIPQRNEFVNAEEMAKCIARSKGMMLAEFVADISRHTADKGHELRAAMKAETTSFSEYVERIVTQRVKDIGDLLDEKQATELIKIQKDYDKWQAELSVCRKRLKELVPDFDIDAYRKDRDYLKKIMTVDMANPSGEDKFKEWKEENCHRLRWFMSELHKLTDENAQVIEEITKIKVKQAELERKESEKHKCQSNILQNESRKNKMLKQRSENLSRDIAALLVLLEN